ncbi:hypothetical protein [Cellulomonas sp. Marseille-Q8402]
MTQPTPTEPVPTEPLPSGPDGASSTTPVPVGHDGREDVPLLEDDETIPPRPEEEVADVARAVPDRAGHGEPELGGADDARLHP